MRCTECGSENPLGQNICAICGKAFSRLCGNCGAENPPRFNFCGGCGASLTEPSESTRLEISSSETPEAKSERRQLTVLFSDLVNSTGISESLDPEEWRELATRYRRAAADAVHRFEGYVADYLGDGIVAYFGWPQAHDDDAERAMRAGLALLEAIAILNHIDQGKHPKLSVRIGIHTGPVVIAATDQNQVEIFGSTANIASRVQSTAEPDTVLITADAHRLVSGLFLVEERGPHALKGLAKPIELYRVLRASGMRGRFAAGAAARGLTPFIGRQDELAILIDRWERALQNEAQTVLITGEAGIGKSRLVLRFREQIAGTRHTWIEAATAPFYKSTPFFTVTDMLRQLFRWHGDQKEEERLGQLESSLELAGLNFADAVPLIAPLMGLAVPEKFPVLVLAPDQHRTRLLAILAEWVFGIARAQPLIIATEDLQWVDPSTLELIQLLVEQNARVPLMLIYTARPEFSSLSPPDGNHLVVRLNPLSTEQIRALVTKVAADRTLASAMIEGVVERTGGVPLFAEELTRAVLDSGEDGVLQKIPATLADSLMSRLDRLGPAKRVAQIAAVIGRRFSYQLLREVSEMAEVSLKSALATLCGANLIYKQEVESEAIYLFKHALIQDAAYETLLKSRQRLLHQRVAQTLADSFPTIAETQPEVLARHWARGMVAEPAIAAWRKAAEAALARRAFREAEEAYRQALAALKTLPESPARDVRELELLNALVQVLQPTRGYAAPETVQANLRAQTVAERGGNLAQLLLQVTATWAAVTNTGDHRSGAALADQMLDLSQRESSPLSLGFAHMAQVTTRYFRGDLAGADEHFAQGAAFFAAPEFKQFPGAVANTYGYASWSKWLAGDTGTAREVMLEAITIARENRSPYDLAFTQFMDASLLLFIGEPEEARTLAAESLAISDEHGFELFAAISQIVLGSTMAKIGRAAEGVSLVSQGLGRLTKIETRLSITRYLTDLAQAQALDDSTAAALATVEEALAANPEEIIYRPESLRLRGVLRFKEEQTVLAEADFREALALARKIGAKTWELRAAMELARLLESGGNTVMARDALVPVYSSFRGGTSTRDLRDARSLLLELGWQSTGTRTRMVSH
jgi:class 3 adenylate cyclase/tetratricopeptide (TPR) repeat protein